MELVSLPWLELSVVLPLLGAALLTRVRERDRAIRGATIVCAATLAVTLGAWITFAVADGSESLHWTGSHSVYQREGLAIDRLSAPLLPLAALLYLTTVATTIRTEQSTFSFGRTLVSESILIATLTCRHPWIIIALLAVSLAPVVAELRARKQNPRVFLLHQGISIALLCAGQLLANRGGGTGTAAIAGGLLAGGALIRSGICPFHCWMTDLFERASLGTSLLFVTPITGAYAVMRLAFPVAPPWVLQSIAFLSVFTAVYAAGMGLVQRDVRRFFVYVFLSHSSLVLAGIEAATPVSLAGALFVWLSVGISLLGFGLALRSVEARAGRISLDLFHGLYEHTPFLAGMFLITGLASIGFPGTIGFIGMELLVDGAVGVHSLMGLAVMLAAAMNGTAVVGAYFHIFTGARRSVTTSIGCRTSERVAIVVILVLIIGGGLFPQAGVTSRYEAAKTLLQRTVGAR